MSILVRPKFWLIGIAFLATYLILNTVTAWYQYHGLGITLWSPDNGLSVLLLIEGAEFAPFVLVGEVLTDVLINRVHHSIYVTVLAESALTVGYTGFAAVLRDILKFSPRRTNLVDVISMLLAVPVGATVISLIYCGTLYLAGSLPADQFYSALRHLLDRRYRRNHCDHSGGDGGVHPFIDGAMGLAEKRGDQLVRLHSQFVLGVRAPAQRERRQRVSLVLSPVFANHLDGDARRLRGGRGRAAGDPNCTFFYGFIHRIGRQ